MSNLSHICDVCFSHYGLSGAGTVTSSGNGGTGAGLQSSSSHMTQLTVNMPQNTCPRCQRTYLLSQGCHQETVKKFLEEFYAASSVAEKQVAVCTQCQQQFLSSAVSGGFSHHHQMVQKKVHMERKVQIQRVEQKMYMEGNAGT